MMVGAVVLALLLLISLMTTLGLPGAWRLCWYAVLVVLVPCLPPELWLVGALLVGLTLLRRFFSGSLWVLGRLWRARDGRRQRLEQTRRRSLERSSPPFAAKGWALQGPLRASTQPESPASPSKETGSPWVQS